MDLTYPQCLYIAHSLFLFHIASLFLPSPTLSSRAIVALPRLSDDHFWYTGIVELISQRHHPLCACRLLFRGTAQPPLRPSPKDSTGLEYHFRIYDWSCGPLNLGGGPNPRLCWAPIHKAMRWVWLSTLYIEQSLISFQCGILQLLLLCFAISNICYSERARSNNMRSVLNLSIGLWPKYRARLVRLLLNLGFEVSWPMKLSSCYAYLFKFGIRSTYQTHWSWLSLRLWKSYSWCQSRSCEVWTSVSQLVY